MNCMKLIIQKLMSREADRQTAELQVRITILTASPPSAYPSRDPSADVRRERGNPASKPLRATAPSGSDGAL